MKILQINLTYNIGSTGHIMADLDQVVQRCGHESYMICGYSYEKHVKNLHIMQTFPAAWDLRKDILISRITGRMGYRSKLTTHRAIQFIEEVKPDLIHLHNIHGDYLNCFMLFDYIKEHRIPVVWTLHDCWSFTGRCSHFELEGCNQWKVGCEECSKSQKEVYPITYFVDHSKEMWKDKNNTFTGVEKMVTVTPSEWLREYVMQSYMGAYPCRVIPNGINLNTFKRSDNVVQKSNKKIILGVASSWTSRKGLNDFIKLNQMLDREKYQILLVGLNNTQMKDVPDTIKKVSRTNNIQELVDIYSAADVFVNPTYQDNYPTVNLEAIACGLRVVTYQTGGSPESATAEVGIVVEQGNVEALAEAILRVLSEPERCEICEAYAREHFDKEQKYLEYLDLYQELVTGNVEQRG